MRVEYDGFGHQIGGGEICLVGGGRIFLEWVKPRLTTTPQDICSAYKTVLLDTYINTVSLGKIILKSFFQGEVLYL